MKRVLHGKGWTMTSLRERERVATPDVVTKIRHTTEWIVGLIGAVAALLGAWMYYGPADGTLTLFNSSWTVTNITEGWAFGLLMGGGVFLAAAFGMYAYKLFKRDSEYTPAVLTLGVLALAALAGAVIYLFVWL